VRKQRRFKRNYVDMLDSIYPTASAPPTVLLHFMIQSIFLPSRRQKRELKFRFTKGSLLSLFFFLPSAGAELVALWPPTTCPHTSQRGNLLRWVCKRTENFSKNPSISSVLGPVLFTGSILPLRFNHSTSPFGYKSMYTSSMYTSSLVYCSSTLVVY